MEKEIAGLRQIAGSDDCPQEASGSTTAPRDVSYRDQAPTYAATFKCIGQECEDTCCRDWSIPLDKRTYQLYAQFPQGKLGSIVAKSVSLTPDAADSLFARINLATSGFCPFFTPEQLCGVQKEYGPQALSATCSIYPRTLNNVEGALEGSLALSCPEAARLVLLTSGATKATGDMHSGQFRTDNSAQLPGNAPDALYKPYGSFHQVRDLLIDMVQDRTRPMWQRLLLIGSLCKRLDEISSAEQQALLPGILNDYRRVHQDASVHEQLESMPIDARKKIDVILHLTNERMSEKRSGKRFTDTFWNFIEGIGTPIDHVSVPVNVDVNVAQPADDVLRFREAEERYYRSFFEKRPYILENYILNYIFQNLFPFGRAGSPHFRRQSIFDEYILMATQFAWMNSLLIGISGQQKEDFAEEHVIKTVQSFCRAVEHFPYVLISINNYIKSQKLDSLHGMSILLR